MLPAGLAKMLILTVSVPSLRMPPSSLSLRVESVTDSVAAFSMPPPVLEPPGAMVWAELPLRVESVTDRIPTL